MRNRCLIVFSLGFLVMPGQLFAQSASLGMPMSTAAAASQKPTVRAAKPDPLIGDYSPAARLGPISEVRYEPEPTAELLRSPEERYNWGIRDDAPSQARYRATPVSRRESQFGEKMGEMIDNAPGSNWGNFESDHCFDDMISPVTNPFLFEDPRALTELRPLFFYQSIPSNQYLYRGGNIEYFGLQGRLAITQRLSIVVHKLGGAVINPGSNSVLSSETGFAEIWLGPKYTFYRDEQTGTLFAGGLIFQLPTGSSQIYQDTGKLSLVPYASVAQRFGKTSWGTFNVMDTFGLSFSTNDQRSNFFYNSIHIDFDVANWNRIYPLIEMNWFHYTRNGNASFQAFEGFDFANVGAAVAGTDFLSFAVGARYKISEAIQFGLAAEFPLLGTKYLNNFRLGIDFIWRY